MCLDRLTEKKFNYERENGHYVGYKYLNSHKGYLSLPLQGINNELLPNMWLREEDYRHELDKNLKTIYNNHYTGYKFGFHIYTKHLRHTRKVYFRKVVAQGYQDGEAVIVAKEIYIPTLEE